jgi:Ca-activated chloride channel family protein
VRGLICCLLLCGLAPAAAAATRIEVVLDASQEMWSPLDAGRPRFVAARMALSSWLLERTVDPLELGLRLVAGGVPIIDHGTCEDSALTVPPGPLDAAGWRAALDAVRPAGARPLLLAVAGAATDLGAGNDPRRIVLVTAGEESCFGDRQAAVAALASGVELRVVGVGLAEDAVERFGSVAPTRNATSTASLLAALRWAVEGLPVADASDAPVQIRLTGAPGYETATLVDEITAERRELTAVGEYFVGTAPPGLYGLELAGSGVELAQLDDIAVPAAGGLELSLELPPAPPVDLEVIPDRPRAGGAVFVAFGGAGGVPYRVSLAEAHDPPLAWVDARSADGPEGVAEMRVPDEPATLEVRLHELLAAGPSRVVARATIESTAPEVTLEAPPEVRPFDPLPVSWTGPDNPGDQLSLVKAGSSSEAHSACSPTAGGSPSPLVAPSEEGPWELRYVSGLSGRTLARAAVEVTAVIVTLEAPSEIAAGMPFEVAWEGPAAAADYLALATEAGTGSDYLTLHLATNGSPARFVAPWEPGAYEVRYVEGDGNRIRRRAALSVVPTAVTLKAPRRVAAGTRFNVRWTGPNRPGDYLAVTARGAAPRLHEDWCYTSVGSPASLAAPFEAGDYELRYVSGADAEVLATLPIMVR